MHSKKRGRGDRDETIEKIIISSNIMITIIATTNTQRLSTS